MQKNLREQPNETVVDSRLEHGRFVGNSSPERLIEVGLHERFDEFDFAIPLTLLGTEARHRRLSEVRKLTMRESSSLPVSKCIYERLPYSTQDGGFERAFIEWSQMDGNVLAFCAVSGSCHDFVRLRYMNLNDALAFYYPDFLVRTAQAIYLVETMMRQPLTDPNVQCKLKAASAWCVRVNKLNATQRSGLPWQYVLLVEDAFHEWRNKGASLSELLAFARLRPAGYISE